MARLADEARFHPRRRQRTEPAPSELLDGYPPTHPVFGLCAHAGALRVLHRRAVAGAVSGVDKARAALDLARGARARRGNSDGRVLGLRNAQLRRLLELGPGRKRDFRALAGARGLPAHDADLQQQQNRPPHLDYPGHRHVRAGVVLHVPDAQWDFGQRLRPLLHRFGPVRAIAAVPAHVPGRVSRAADLALEKDSFRRKRTFDLQPRILDFLRGHRPLPGWFSGRHHHLDSGVQRHHHGLWGQSFNGPPRRPDWALHQVSALVFHRHRHTDRDWAVFLVGENERAVVSRQSSVVS